MRPLILALCIGVLASCAAPNASEDPGLAQPLGVDTSCNADELVQRAANGAETRMHLPISLSIPARGTAGQFCMATGCEAARIEPTLTRALGWTARVITNDRSSMNAELQISPDRSSFRLRLADSEGSEEWAGACNAAGS
jgi:hypothetical protein